MNTKLRQKGKIILRKIFQVHEQCSFWKKLWAMWENIEILIEILLLT